MQCAKCYTQVLYCPCCGEKLEVVAKEVEEDLEQTILKPELQQAQFYHKHDADVLFKAPLTEQPIQTKEHINKQTAKLVLVDDSKKDPEVFFLDKQTSLIGRPDLARNSYPEVDLSFDKEGTISRYHAQIHNKEGKFFLEDLSSGNGTFIFDGKQLEKLLPNQLYPLQSRNRVRFGKVLMQFILE